MITWHVQPHRRKFKRQNLKRCNHSVVQSNTEHSSDQRRLCTGVITVLNNICLFWTLNIMYNSTFSTKHDNNLYHARLDSCIFLFVKKKLLDKHRRTYFILTVSSVRIIQFNFVVSFRKLGIYVVDDHVSIYKIHQVTSYKITAGSISILNSVSILSFLYTTCHFIDKHALHPQALHSGIYTASMHEGLQI